MVYTPARTLFISELKSSVLKLPFLLKNDGKEWSRLFILKFTFRVAAAQCKNICQEWPNWLGSLAGISEGAW